MVTVNGLINPVNEPLPVPVMVLMMLRMLDEVPSLPMVTGTMVPEFSQLPDAGVEAP